MQKVTVQRTEYREHVFDIPDNVEEGSDEWCDILNDFDWHDATIHHADESEIAIVRDEPSAICDCKLDTCKDCRKYDISDDDNFECTGCKHISDIENSMRVGHELYCDRCGSIEVAKIEVAKIEVAERQMGDASP